MFLVRDTPVVKCTESSKKQNPQAQMSQEFHSHWRLNLVPARFSKETGKKSQDMLGRPGQDDWFCDPHKDHKYPLGPCGMDLKVLYRP